VVNEGSYSTTDEIGECKTVCIDPNSNAQQSGAAASLTHPTSSPEQAPETSASVAKHHAAALARTTVAHLPRLVKIDSGVEQYRGGYLRNG
jgi:hypothetical protein